MTGTETEVIADEGPCACDPKFHRVKDSRKNESGSITRRRYKCSFCLRRWTMYDLTVAEMESMREKLTHLARLEKQIGSLVKAIGKT